MTGRMCPASWFKLLIKLVGFICYLVHMYFIFYNQVFPSETFTRLVEKQLDHIEFPVIFKLCVTPAQCSPTWISTASPTPIGASSWFSMIGRLQ